MSNVRARSRRPRGPRLCTKCHAPVAWWHNANRPGGWLKVDLSPDRDRGQVRKIVITNAGVEPLVSGRVLSGQALVDALADDVELFTLHSTTCSAGRPRNPKPPGLQIVRPGQQ